MGELTLIGQQQARDLGAWLRQRYVDQLSFLPPDMQVGKLTSHPQHTAPVRPGTDSSSDTIKLAAAAGRLRSYM